MIRLSEAWSHFDTTYDPCAADRDSYGLDELDIRIAKAIGRTAPSTFVELGAYDGITQSNSVLLEADICMARPAGRGQSRKLRPVRCVRARPKVLVEHADCVSGEFEGTDTITTDAGLMSLTRESDLDNETRADWISRGVGLTGQPPQEIEVPVATLSALLDKNGMTAPDVLLLDVEGAEISVLEELDFDRHAPSAIAAEAAHDECISMFLAVRDYVRQSVLSEHRFTRDCLYALPGDARRVC